MTLPPIPAPLVIALASVARMEFVEVCGAWARYGQRFACRLRLTLEVAPTEFIPRQTEWYAVVSSDYPAGDIDVYPAKVGGIIATFPHQNFNGDGHGEKWGRLPWRTGKVCLDHPFAFIDRRDAAQPLDAESRLAWNIVRAHHWLTHAACNMLLRDGHPFELPYLPEADGKFEAIFIENEADLSVWTSQPARQGVVEFVPCQGNWEMLRVHAFLDEQRRCIRRIDWNDIPLAGPKETRAGLWVRLDRMPIERPWRIPMNWGELTSACLGAETDLGGLLDRHSVTMRDGFRHPVLIGFPIPTTMGGPAVRLHWFAMRLPKLSDAKSATKAGYRGKHEPALLSCDKLLVRHPKHPIPWIVSANWAEDQIRSRGSLSRPLTEAKIALIGAGALGSMVAELLVRAGANVTVIMDPQSLVAGNTSRHALTLREVGMDKAAALANRLQAIQPLLRCCAIGDAFPPADDKHRGMLEDADLILECTGADMAMQHLRDYSWMKSRHFVSLSLGWRGQRLYAYGVRAPYFPVEDFRERYSAWRGMEADAREGDDMPWEGIGCWHPVFPARADDVALGAAIGVKFIEEMVAAIKDTVFEVFDLSQKSFRVSVPPQ